MSIVIVGAGQAAAQRVLSLRQGGHSRPIRMIGDLSAEQCLKLMEIADKCREHRTLTSEISIRTTEKAAA